MRQHDGAGGGRGRLVLRIVLSVIPFLAVCGAAPLVNRVTPYVLGMPFLVFWVGLWTVLTSVCMALVHLLRPAETPSGTPSGAPSCTPSDESGLS